MPCDDDEATEELVAGADWVFWWTLDEELSDGDLADWEDLIVEARYRGGLIATSQGDDPTIVTTGSFDGEAGEIPATDFDAGVVAWVVPAAVTADVDVPLVTVQAWTRRGGPDGPFFTQTYPVVPRVAVRDEEGS